MNKRIIVGLLALWVMSTAMVNAQNSDVAITLERTACFGTCPMYTVSILNDGTVIYNGERFVDITGEQTSTIDPETVELMVQQLEEAGYFNWDEAYDAQTVTDLPSVITSVTRNGERHHIMRYAGDTSAPLALPYLEQWIDIMANTAMWTGVQADIVAVSNSMNPPLLTLQRDPCFGFCPVYNVAVFEDGTIIYTGIANVDTLGVEIFETDAVAVTSIPVRAQSTGYFDWEDSYTQQVITDQVTVTTSIQWEDQFKRIVRYGGDPNAPVGLLWVEENIELLVADLVGEGI